jgi:hypothetical protein
VKTFKGKRGSKILPEILIRDLMEAPLDPLLAHFTVADDMVANDKMQHLFQK